MCRLHVISFDPDCAGLQSPGCKTILSMVIVSLRCPYLLSWQSCGGIYHLTVIAFLFTGSLNLGGLGHTGNMIRFDGLSSWFGLFQYCTMGKELYLWRKSCVSEK